MAFVIDRFWTTLPPEPARRTRRLRRPAVAINVRQAILPTMIWGRYSQIRDIRTALSLCSY